MKLVNSTISRTGTMLSSAEEGVTGCVNRGEVVFGNNGNDLLMPKLTSLMQETSPDSSFDERWSLCILEFNTNTVRRKNNIVTLLSNQ